MPPPRNVDIDLSSPGLAVNQLEKLLFTGKAIISHADEVWPRLYIGDHSAICTGLINPGSLAGDSQAKIIREVTMLRGAVLLWISCALCQALRHGGQDVATEETDQDTAQDNSVSLVKTANKEFAFRLYSALASQFLGKDVSEVVTQGTAVFVDNKFKPTPEFLDTLKQSYFTDGFTVDFTKTTDSADTINKYVSDKTSGKIDKMVDGLSEGTVMYLLSYIYFKGQWETPFDPQQTQEDMFEVNDTTKVPVQMMNMQDTFDFYRDKETNSSALHLPFNSTHCMLLLLPDSMEALEKVLCPCLIERLLKSMESSMLNLFIPKFSIKTSYALKDVLSEMGIKDIFSPGADLSGIADGVVVSSVTHKATLDVDESGATASAATGIEFVKMAILQPPVLKFKHPFMVFIIDRHSKDFLFMGKIINPTI
ncbi:hypothetical protein WMY93_004771 [Mugilogobius chulae]|uniref:Thyroxine-binding globulin n=1 Tax=Mugilogobius chulae TaxID=88201 RepID=A0AAW0Q4I7_9GOBI